MKDKELFDLWENKIKTDLIRNIDLQVRLWSSFEHFGHRVAARFIKNKCNINTGDTILEIGCGTCSLTRFLDKPLQRNYIGLDISSQRLNMTDSGIKKIHGDIYKLPFADGSIKCIVSIFSLEHFHNLDEALMEIMRVMDKNGILIFAIPMEDGILYNLCRNYTSRRFVEKRYGVDYMKIIREYEHPNTAFKVIDKVKEKFTITNNLYLPFFIPSVNINLLAVYKAVKNESNVTSIDK